MLHLGENSAKTRKHLENITYPRGHHYVTIIGIGEVTLFSILLQVDGIFDGKINMKTKKITGYTGMNQNISEKYFVFGRNHKHILLIVNTTY